MINKKNIDLGILILNWNCREKILKCLETVKRAGYIGNTLIADNGSDDGSLEEIRKHFAAAAIVENGENLGFAAGNNSGITYCLKQGSEYIFILNPDTEINGNTIPPLIKAMEEDRKIGIAGPKIFSPDGKIWSAGGVLDKKRYSGGLIGLGEEDGGRYDEKRKADYIPGTAMMVRRDVFEKCGLFNPEYFIYYEDVEMSLRAQKAGFKLMFVPSATLIHHESASMGKNSPVQEYYMARNHLLFVERNAPLSVKIRELARLPKTVREHRQKGENQAIRGIKDYFLRKFGKTNYEYRS